MKRFALMAALSVSTLAISAGASFADYTLHILHINDLHSRIEAINAFDSTCSDEDAAEGKCFGGIARVATKINERRSALEQAGENVIVLDAGDQFQGSLFYTTYKGADTVEFMNQIGFDAMAVGNHEFDDGPPVLGSFIDAAQFPVISGNTEVAESETSLAGKIEEWVILEEGGERVGVLSVLATDTDVTSSGGPNVTFAEETAYLKDAVSRMEAEGVNKIILLSHVGLPRDQEIAAAVDGIDVIVGGHSHTLMSNTEEGAPAYPTLVKNPSGEDVPIVQAYAYSKYLGELEVTFDDQGKVISASGDPILLDNSVTPDPEIEARVAELAAPIEEAMGEVVSETTAPIDGSRETCRAGECEMGVLVTDAMLDRTADQGVTIAITNGGGLRASIDQGEVTMGEVFEVLPFQNTLATMELAGADIVASLESGVSQIEEGAGRFPQVAGLRYSFDRTAPAGSRIQSVEVRENGQWVPLDPGKTYTVATNNFMRGGGDGYDLFETNAQNAYDFGPGLEQVVADYLAENRPYTPQLDGRITEVTGAAEPAAAAPAVEAETEEDAAAPTTTETDAAAAPAATAPATDAAATTPPSAATDAEEDATAPAASGTDASAAAPASGTSTTPPADTNAAPGTLAANPDPAGQPAEATDTAQEMATAPADATTGGPASETVTAAAEDAADPIEPVTEPAESAAAPAADAAATAPATDTAAAPADENAADPIEPIAEPSAEAQAAEETAMAETAADAASSSAAPTTYTIVAGDSLWKLADRFYGDGREFTRLRDANPDIDPGNLEIGETLTVPPAN